MEAMFYIILFLIIACVYFIPTIIAFRRNHHYKWIILGMNAILGATGVGYLVSFAWAIWPKKTAIFDVFVNDPTSNSTEDGREIYGRLGSNVSAFREGRDGVIEITPTSTVQIERELLVLLNYHKAGGLSREEFIAERNRLLAQRNGDS